MADLNEATGEVTVELDGETYVLVAHMPRVAALQAKLQVTGLRGMEAMIREWDTRAVYHGLSCLCSSGNVDKLETLRLAPNVETAAAAILVALLAGLPEPDDEEPEGNAEATKETT